MATAIRLESGEPEAAPPRIVLADDHALMRAAVRADLEDSGFLVCAEAESAAGAVAETVRHRPELCLLDIHMPGSGIAAAWEITERVTETTVVMLTVSRDDEDLFASFRAGASGYLLKDLDLARLPAALNRILAGEPFVPRMTLRRVAEELAGRPGPLRRLRQNGTTLTEGEREVLEGLCEGCTPADVAARLELPLEVVSARLRSVLAKLRAPDRESALAGLAARY